MRKQGAHHPSLNPYNLPENKKLKVKYSKNMCKDSLDVLSRAVLIPMHPDNNQKRVRAIGAALKGAA